MDEKKLLGFTEISEEFERLRFHFKESHKHALLGTSSLLKIVSLLLEQNLEMPGARAVNTVVLLIKASVDIWAARVSPESPEINEAKKEAYKTILGVLEAERELIISRGQAEEKKEYLAALESVMELIKKELSRVDGDEESGGVVEIPIE